MKVIISGITNAFYRHCIGAFEIDTGKRLRLCPAYTGPNFTYLSPPDQFWPTESGFLLGTIWEIEGYEAKNLRPPHVEDYIVTSRRQIGSHNVSDYMKAQSPSWSGNMRNLFDGRLREHNGKFYVSHSDTIQPPQSTGEWKSDRQFRFENGRYIFTALQKECSVAYVGIQAPLESIPTGTLLRFSLAKPWRGTGMDDYRCYLQLSGWFL